MKIKLLITVNTRYKNISIIRITKIAYQILMSLKLEYEYTGMIQDHGHIFFQHSILQTGLSIMLTMKRFRIEDFENFEVPEIQRQKVFENFKTVKLSVHYVSDIFIYGIIIQINK